MKISPTQSDFLNLARWVAAWLVLAEHARSFIFENYGSLESPGIVAKAFYFMTGFGHEAVMVFFVISGYLVGGKAWTKIRTRKFRWKAFLCDRLSRLYAVLVVALVIGFLMDYSGSRFFNSFGIYDLGMEEPIPIVNQDFSQQIGPIEFFGNLAFTQTIFVETYGSNGPLWSLANEWWYYILFPLLVSTCIGSVRIRLISIVLAVGLVLVLTKPILVLFGVWLLGAAVAQLQRRLFPVWLAVLLFVAASVVARLETLKIPFCDQFLLGAAIAVLLNSLYGREKRYPFAGISSRLADFSYTLYLLHFPFLALFLSVLYSTFDSGLRMPFSVKGLSLFLISCGLSLGFAWLLSIPTESRTSVYRNQLYRIFRIERESTPTSH